MDGRARIQSIFRKYSNFEFVFPLNPGNPLVAFRNPLDASPSYASGNGFTLANQSVIMHDETSLARFLELARLLHVPQERGLRNWETALSALKRQRRLSAA